MPQSAGGDAEADSSASKVALQEVIQELNALKTGFKRVLEALVMIKGDTANLMKRNSMPDKFMEILSVLKSEQQAYHKNQKEFLERFAQSEKDTILHISEKMESLSTSVRNRMEEPDVVCHRHSISIDTPYIFWTLIILLTYSIVVSVAFYIEKRHDNDRMDNDLKYRYIKMKGEAAFAEQARLKEQAAKELDSKAKSIKSKSIGNESKK